MGDITAADLKSVLNHWMEQGYAYTTVKKVHILLNEYFRYLTEENFIQKNPMQSVPMMKKANFLAAQDKECVSEQEQSDSLHAHRNRKVQARSVLHLC